MQTPDVINHRTLSKECLSRASTFEWSLNSRISLAKMFQFHYWVEQWNIHVQAGFRSRAARHSTRTGWSLSDRTNVAARQRCMASISNRWTNQQKINRKNAECLFHLFSCVFFCCCCRRCVLLWTLKLTFRIVSCCCCCHSAQMHRVYIAVSPHCFI